MLKPLALSKQSQCDVSDFKTLFWHEVFLIKVSTFHGNMKWYINSPKIRKNSKFNYEIIDSQ